MKKEDMIVGLYFVYWNSGTRKCMVDAASEEEAIKKLEDFVKIMLKFIR